MCSVLRYFVERHFFECSISLLADWGFLFYVIRNTLAKKLNFFGTKTTKWAQNSVVVNYKYIDTYGGNC